MLAVGPAASGSGGGMKRRLNERYEMVYFIQNTANKHIKIGRSKDIKARLSTLQTGNSNKLNLIGYGFGSKEMEKAIHMEFKDDHIIGEWFKPSKELFNLATSLNAMRLTGFMAAPDDIKGFKKWW